MKYIAWWMAMIAATLLTGCVADESAKQAASDALLAFLSLANSSPSKVSNILCRFSSRLGLRSLSAIRRR